MSLSLFNCFGSNFFIGQVSGQDIGSHRIFDFAWDCVLGGRTFLAVWEYIFLRTTFGAAALSGGWSQPSKTVIKPIKQAKLQMMGRYFFIMVKMISCLDVKTYIRYQFIFFSFFSYETSFSF